MEFLQRLCRFPPTVTMAVVVGIDDPVQVVVTAVFTFPFGRSGIKDI